MELVVKETQVGLVPGDIVVIDFESTGTTPFLLVDIIGSKKTGESRYSLLSFDGVSHCGVGETMEEIKSRLARHHHIVYSQEAYYLTIKRRK